jgi:predicted dithiol-disulfide oxidoreductase (DUF899 family)
MDLPEVVSAEEWEAAQKALRAREREQTRRSDELAAERRRLPRMGTVWSLLDITP